MLDIIIQKWFDWDLNPPGAGAATIVVEDAWAVTDGGDESLDGEAWTFESSGPVVASVTPASTQYYGEDAELSDQDSDELWPLDEGISFPAALSVEDAWDWFVADEDPLPTDDYALVDLALVACPEDSWDHFAQDEAEPVAVGGAFQQSDLDVLPIEDPWDWRGTDDDDYLIIDDYALVDFVNTTSPVEDAWQHWLTEDDDYVVIDDCALIENLAPVEDAWEWFLTDDDEQVDVAEFALISVPLTTLQYYGEDAESADADQDDDEWLTRTADVLGASVSPTLQYFGAEAEWAEDEAEVSWTLDEAVSSPDSLLPVDDAWDHFRSEDDEQPLPDEAQSTTFVNALLCVQDGWDHFLTDEDDYVVTDDYQFPVFVVVDMMGVSFSGSVSFGTLVAFVPRGPYLYDPRFFNGSNAWLGYRSAGGGGIW